MRVGIWRGEAGLDAGTGQGVAEDAEHDARADVAVATVQPAGVADQQALPRVEVDDMQMLADHGAEQRDDGGDVGGEGGEVVEAEPDTRSAGAGGFADGSEVPTRGAEAGGSRRGQRGERGGVLPGEGCGDAGGVGEQRVAAVAGGLLAGEHE